jgi:hypothetical protein
MVGRMNVWFVLGSMTGKPRVAIDGRIAMEQARCNWRYMPTSPVQAKTHDKQLFRRLWT